MHRYNRGQPTTLVRRAHWLANHISMNDLSEKDENDRGDRESTDPLSERLVVLVAIWIAAAVLLPVHLLFAYNLFFTSPAIGHFTMLLVFGLPLAVIDVVAYRWFRENYSVFRWINRSDDAIKRRNDRR